MRRIICLLVIPILIINACKSQKTGGEDASSNDQQENGLTLVMSDLYGGADTELIEVIRSQKALDKFFVHVNKTRKPGIKPPVIDFEKNTVIVYCSGKTNQSSLPQLIAEEDQGDKIYLSKNMPESIESQGEKAVLMPFGLYIMPLTDKEVLLQPDS